MLGLAATKHDRDNPDFLKQRLESLEKSETARRLALQGVPAQGGVAVFQNDPFFHAREIWTDRCGGCHSLDGHRWPERPGFRGLQLARLDLRLPGRSQRQNFHGPGDD